MTVEDEAVGLRERKRRATRRAILIAAIRAVRDRGLDGATVDEISRIADVSPRTFFNYFPSKEDAILGDPPDLALEEAGEFVDDRGPLLPGLARVIAASVVAVSDDPEVAILRKKIVTTHPELGMRRMARVERFELDLTDLVRRRLLSQWPDLASDDRELTQRARLTALVAIAAMRHAWHGWIDGRDDESIPLADRIDDSFARLAALVDPLGSGMSRL